MKTAEASIYLDRLRPKKNGRCSVKIRISFNRKRKYFATGIDLVPTKFEAIMNAKRRTTEQKEIHTKLNHLLTKAETVIKNLPVFTFGSFEESFFEQRNTQDSVSFAFDKYIQHLTAENRLGTAVSYQCAKNSIELFKKDLTFAEATPSLLKQYENWMLNNNKSISTVGIYLRSFRTIYNLQNIDKSLYPFGEGNKKYSIPTSRNIKKALSLEDIAKIYHYQAVPGSKVEMAKDYWLFLYLCNGMNVKDFCLLKWINIDGDMLTYKRAKTQRTRKEHKAIEVALKLETFAIIKKWGQPSLSKQSFIFPHLKNGMSAKAERATYQQLTKIINKYMKQICADLMINKNVTTYFARHSFATVLKRSGAKNEFISEMLGHSSVHITDLYLDSFEKEHIQRETDALTSGFKKIN